MNPLTAFATLVCTKVFETGAEKLAEGTLETINRLREKIWQKLRGKPEVEKVLHEAKDGTPFALEQVAGYLGAAMQEDKVFAEEVREEIEDAMKEDEAFAKAIGDRARDIFNIDKVDGDNWIVTGGRAAKQGVSGDITGDGHTFIFGDKPD